MFTLNRVTARMSPSVCRWGNSPEHPLSGLAHTSTTPSIKEISSTRDEGDR